MMEKNSKDGTRKSVLGQRHKRSLETDPVGATLWRPCTKRTDYEEHLFFQYAVYNVKEYMVSSSLTRLKAQHKVQSTDTNFPPNCFGVKVESSIN